MSVRLFTHGFEATDPGATVWRFMPLRFFADLISSGQLYLCRSDLYNDQHEGMPPREWIRRMLGLHPLDILDNQALDNHLGSLAQDRQTFYLNCWYLFDEETARMWGQYGKEGVAVTSRYSLLKAVLDEADEKFYISRVRYGWDSCLDYNVQSFITTKRSVYAPEREVRIGVWKTNSGDGGNRHIDMNNRAQPEPVYAPPSTLPPAIRRPINVQKLILGVVLNPSADDAFTRTVKDLVAQQLGREVPVNASCFAGRSHWLPTAEELRQYQFDRTPLLRARQPELPRLPEPPPTAAD